MELRYLSHEMLREIVARPLRKEVRGRDKKLYKLRVSATPVPGSEDLEITVRLKHGWFGRPLLDTFVVAGPRRPAVPPLEDDAPPGTDA